MIKKIFIFLVIVVVLGGAVLYFTVFQKGEAPPPRINSFEECVSAGYPVLESYPRQCKTPDGQTFTEDIGSEREKADLIRVDAPRPNAAVESPIVIEGEARGFWFFEATFPVKLLDKNGDVIQESYAQTQGEWMTESFVPFTAQLSFEVSDTQEGILVLEKANPSDLPEQADELRIPVILQETGAQRTVKLYYYNPELDKDDTGNILCSRQGLVSVERKIPVANTPIQDTVRLLLQGKLTPEERAQGVTTEYPLANFSLRDASLKDGVLTLRFDDPGNRAVGGACRVGVLWFQIEATVKQFPEVQEVNFSPEELFQP